MPRGTEWNEPDPEFLKRRDYFRFGLSPPKRVFALECSDRLDCMGATNRFCACLRKSEVLDLALLNQILHRSGDVFNRHVRVDPMLVEQIDHIGLEPLERAFDGFLDVFRPAIQARRSLLPGDRN